MIRKLINLLFLLAVLTACGGVNSNDDIKDASVEIEIIDDLGRTIILHGYPTRIVSTAASITDMLFAIGAGDLLVGRDDFSTYPEQALNIPSIGSFWNGVPAEAILALEPDLVIAAQIISPDQVQELEDLGFVVYWQANPEKFEDLYDNLLDLAAITGMEAEAKIVIENLQSRVFVVEEKLAGLDKKVTVFYELDATDPQNPWTTGSGTFIDYIISAAGGINAAASLEGDYAQLSSEALIETNPDVIILADAEYGVTLESVSSRAGWETISALQNGRVYPFDPGLLSVPGTRLVDGYEQLAKLLYPELFDE